MNAPVLHSELYWPTVVQAVGTGVLVLATGALVFVTASLVRATSELAKVGENTWKSTLPASLSMVIASGYIPSEDMATFAVENKSAVPVTLTRAHIMPCVFSRQGQSIKLLIPGDSRQALTVGDLDSNETSLNCKFWDDMKEAYRLYNQQSPSPPLNTFPGLQFRVIGVHAITRRIYEFVEEFEMKLQPPASFSLTFVRRRKPEVMT